LGIDLELATMPMGVAFGKYELLERIATGGMAEIYRAVSSSVGGFRKQVALKRILPHLSSDEEFVSLFVSEAKLAVELSHSNVVQILDFGRVEDTYYLAMELVDGRDLTEVLMKQARLGAMLPLEAVCYLLAEVCRGLEYAHTRCGPDGRPLGIVHRDVSPHNVLVSYDGEIKLTDFGVAKARSRVAEERPGALLGKYAYMSPEQARGDDVDARSDVYSAGVTLFESLTGRRLFYHEDPQLTLQRVRRPSVVPPSSYRPEIPAALDRIVMSALAPRADDRTPSARALATELQSFLRELAPGYNDSHLSRTMKDLFEDEVGAARFAMAAPTAPERTAAIVVPGSLAPSELGDPVLEALAERLEHDPSLWTLVELTDRLQRLERPLEAERALILGAAKFAQNGLLVQALDGERRGPGPSAARPRRRHQLRGRGPPRPAR
jgi:serine/threonine protein kinase